MFGIYRLNYDQLAVFIPLYSTICGLIHIGLFSVCILVYKCIIPYKKVPSESEGIFGNAITLLVKRYLQDFTCSLRGQSIRSPLTQYISPYSVSLASYYIIGINCLWILTSYILYYGFISSRTTLINIWRIVCLIRTISLTLMGLYLYVELGLYLSENVNQLEATLSTIIMKCMVDGTPIFIVFDLVLLNRALALLRNIQLANYQRKNTTEVYVEPPAAKLPGTAVADDLESRMKSFEEFKGLRVSPGQSYLNEIAMTNIMRDSLAKEHVSYNPYGRVYQDKRYGVNLGYVHDEPSADAPYRPYGDHYGRSRNHPHEQYPDEIWSYDQKYHRPWSYLKNQDSRDNKDLMY